MHGVFIGTGAPRARTGAAAALLQCPAERSQSQEGVRARRYDSYIISKDHKTRRLGGLWILTLSVDDDVIHLPERRIFRKYALKAESNHVVLKMAFLDDDAMFEELSIRIVSEIVRAVGSKDTPPRLASIARLVRELKQLASGKTLTLGGCRVRLFDSVLLL